MYVSAVVWNFYYSGQYLIILEDMWSNAPCINNEWLINMLYVGQKLCWLLCLCLCLSLCLCLCLCSYLPEHHPLIVGFCPVRVIVLMGLFSGVGLAVTSSLSITISKCSSLGPFGLVNGSTCCLSWAIDTLPGDLRLLGVFAFFPDPVLLEDQVMWIFVCNKWSEQPYLFCLFVMFALVIDIMYLFFFL